jgi:hypothetical protein
MGVKSRLAERKLATPRNTGDHSEPREQQRVRLGFRNGSGNRVIQDKVFISAACQREKSLVPVNPL